MRSSPTHLVTPLTTQTHKHTPPARPPTYLAVPSSPHEVQPNPEDYEDAAHEIYGATREPNRGRFVRFALGRPTRSPKPVVAGLRPRRPSRDRFERHVTWSLTVRDEAKTSETAAAPARAFSLSRSSVGPWMREVFAVQDL